MGPVGKAALVFLRLATPIVFAMHFWGIWRPSVWEDEVATIGGANRSLASLWELVHRVDLVHGTYYLLVHFWGQVFGFSPVSIRTISALAITASFVFVYLTARLLGSARFARYSSMIFAFLPAITWGSTEARSYALAVLVATLLTYLFVRNLESGRWWLYFVVAAVGVYLFMYLILVVAAHGLVLVALRKPIRRVLGFLVGGLALMLTSLPLTLGAMSQSHQVSWITMPKPWLVPTDALVMPYFLYSLWPPIVAFVVLLAGWLVSRKSREPVGPLLTSLILSMLLAPPAALLLLSLVTQPVYVPRYVMFGAGAMAMLLGLAVERMPRRWLRVTAMGLILVAAAPSYLEYRAPDGKLTDWRQSAEIMADQAKPGDAVLFSDDQARATISRSVFAYPELFSGVSDLTLIPESKTPRLLQRHSLQPSMVSKLGSYQRVWLLNDTSIPAQQATVARMSRELSAAGFRLAETKTLRFSSVLLFEKRR